MQPDLRRRSDTRSWFEKAYEISVARRLIWRPSRQRLKMPCTIASKQQRKH